MKITALYVLLGVAAVAALPPASAAPSDAHAVFRRSCDLCAPEDYCEFAYPGAPAGSVACVKYRSSVHLYRRYGDPFTQCGTGSDCCGAFLSSMPTPPASLQECTDACNAYPGCAYVTYGDTAVPKTCAMWSSCNEFEEASGMFPVYARGQNACPTTATGC